MEHEGLEDLTNEQVDAMQEGMDKLIANNRDGGAKKGKDHPPTDAGPGGKDQNKNRKDSDGKTKKDVERTKRPLVVSDVILTDTTSLTAKLIQKGMNIAIDAKVIFTKP